MKLFIIPLLVWLVAVVVKIMISRGSGRNHIMYYGGWPSMHATFVTSLTTVVWLELGLDSAAFAIALIFSLIVISDSLVLRRAIGEQAKAFNQAHKAKLPEEMGHRRREVAAGILLGVLLTLLLNQMVF